MSKGLLAGMMTLVACFAGAAKAQSGEWLTSYKEAVRQAENAKLPIMADFTGSDWCGWCMKLKSEVFDTSEFKTWARKNVILLEVDFPHGKVQSEELKRQNAELAAKFGIRGYPTIVFIDSNGRSIGRMGYQVGGPSVWTSAASKLLRGAKGLTSGHGGGDESPRNQDDAAAVTVKSGNEVEESQARGTK